MSMNFGLAMSDVAVASEIYKRALEKGIGVRLPL
jgi:ornithine cyclodeaminase/alanine dehydrogenase-like protein (mu-crystallin family)